MGGKVARWLNNHRLSDTSQSWNSAIAEGYNPRVNCKRNHVDKQSQLTRLICVLAPDQFTARQVVLGHSIDRRRDRVALVRLIQNFL
jgi:hypothetical protein